MPEVRVYKYRTGCRFGLSRAACAVATRSATSKTSGIMESVSWMVAATSYPLTQGMESNGRPRQRARSSGSVESENNRDRMMKSRNRSVAAAACFQPPCSVKAIKSAMVRKKQGFPSGGQRGILSPAKSRKVQETPCRRRGDWRGQEERTVR